MLRIDSPAQLGAVLRATRTALNIPATDLAAMADTSAVLLRRLEQGNATTALQKLFVIMEELGIELNLALPPQVGSIKWPSATEKPRRTRVRT